MKKVKGAGGPYYPDDSIYDCRCLLNDVYDVLEQACVDIHGNFYSKVCS